jgi:tRNA pseudouridine38-40 synthase
MSSEAGAPAGRRFALLLEYDGTAYRGSQYQDNGPSIQAALESSIGKLTGDERRVSFAGRTDAGVHALGQVASFETPSRLSASELMRGINHFLPHDIVVRALKEVDAKFDPRRDARGRVYRYRIDARTVRSPLLRDRAWHVARAIDVDAMRDAARRLEGPHDFAAFAGPYDGLTKRTLRRCAVSESCGLVEVEMEAEAFLPHQVRRTVGPLVEVGAGRMALADLVALLETARPSSAGPAAPACGLYLLRVEYDGLDFEAVGGSGQDE